MPGFKFIILVFTFSARDLVEGKKQIEVGEALALSLCEQTKSFVKTATIQPPLKESTVKVGGEECMQWRWIKCDWPAEEHLWCSEKPSSELKPCGTWERVPCVHSSSGQRTYCETFQCGWTLDELHLNWGYNPEHIYPNWTPKATAANDDIIQTGKLLDFHSSFNNNNSISIPTKETVTLPEEPDEEK